MRESWSQMQVPIFGVVGILIIFLLVAVKFGLPTDNFVGSAYATLVPTELVDGDSCDVTFYDPVCCSDGVTYDNLCLCREAGEVPEYQGICR